jgi:circadian clock protein KaiB
MNRTSFPKKSAGGLEKLPASEKYLLRLYVSGMTERSRRSILNISTLCKNNLQGNYDLEVVDINQKPSLAMDEQIDATPTLIRMLPLPLLRIVGDLSNSDRVLVELDIDKGPSHIGENPKLKLQDQYANLAQ